ncbi:unnamed protein product [Amoebophrya sp. A120]|nr:unnamed protein product [Amoebophrya sp. A120]|eukprot:GSA120T00013106001.1
MAGNKKRGTGKSKGFFKKAGKNGKKKKTKKKLDREDLLHKKIEGREKELQRIEKKIAKEDRRLQRVAKDNDPLTSGEEDAEDVEEKTPYEKLLESMKGQQHGTMSNNTDGDNSDSEQDLSSADEDEDMDMEDVEDSDEKKLGRRRATKSNRTGGAEDVEPVEEEDIMESASDIGEEEEEFCSDEEMVSDSGDEAGTEKSKKGDDNKDEESDADISLDEDDPDQQAAVRQRTLHGLSDDEVSEDEVLDEEEQRTLLADNCPAAGRRSSKNAQEQEQTDKDLHNHYGSFGLANVESQVDFTTVQKEKLAGKGFGTSTVSFTYGQKDKAGRDLAKYCGGAANKSTTTSPNKDKQEMKKKQLSCSPASSFTQHSERGYTRALKGNDKEFVERWSSREHAAFHHLNRYQDVVLPTHTFANSRTVRSTYMTHVVNHVLKAREEVVANNTKIAKQQKQAEEKENNNDDDENASFLESARDQGFCRARVLILCSYRSVAFELVKMLEALCPNAKQVLKQSKFDEQFAEGPNEDVEQQINDSTTSTKKPKSSSWTNDTAKDLQHCFSGNNDDKFRVGVSVSKRALKLFTPFYQSDILICSPLGLRLIIGAEGESAKQREYDFLSSLECVVLDRVDILKYQNFDHVLDVLKMCNKKPKKLPENCDIGRLRECFALNESRLLRQTIVTSNGNCPELNALLVSDKADDEADELDVARAGKKNKKNRVMSKNYETATEILLTGGKNKMEENDATTLVPFRTNFRGAVKFPAALENAGEELIHYAREHFAIERHMFLVVKGNSKDSSSSTTISKQNRALKKQLQDVEDTPAEDTPLFKQFQKQFWRTTGTEMEYLVIVVSGSGYRYCDFFRIKRFFEEEGVDHVALDEYAEWLKVKEARMEFNKGNLRVLLLTERFLFYHPEFDIKNAQNLCFFGTPEKSYMLGLSWLSPYSKTKDMALVPAAAFTLVDQENDDCALERILGTEFVRKKFRKVDSTAKMFTFS